MARALISMKYLQEQHVDVIKKKHVDELSHDEVMRKALDSALGELKSQLRTLGRALRYGEWEVIQPIVVDGIGIPVFHPFVEAVGHSPPLTTSSNQANR